MTELINGRWALGMNSDAGTNQTNIRKTLPMDRQTDKLTETVDHDVTLTRLKEREMEGHAA